MSEEGGVRSDGLACLRENLIPMPTFSRSHALTLSHALTSSVPRSYALTS